MGKAFFTKKQKAQMRERQKKKKLLHNKSQSNVGDNDTPTTDQTSGNILMLESSSKLPTKKRPRTDDADVEFSTNHRAEESIADSASVTTLVGEIKNSSHASVVLTTKMIAQTLYVLIPSNLSTKDARKFRKDARRKLAQPQHNNKNKNSNDYDDIEFATQEDMPSLRPSKQKRKKREFPSIKELLKQKSQIEEIQKEESKLKEKLNSIPESVRAQYIALDCEMVGIGTDGKKSALARVSIVDWNLNILLDTFVQVPIRVTDFRTHVSGVEAKHIKSKNNAMPVKPCRDLVAKLIKNKILVGHALTNDFKALMMSHPKETIRDTAKYRPFQRYGNGKWRARKLRDLVKENLNDKDGFQEGEHDSVQDAKANMELFQVVFSQWEKELENKNITR